MRYAPGVLLLAMLASGSCTERELTRGRASELIQALDGFTRVAYFTIPVAVPFRSTFNCESQTSVERDPLHHFLVKSGWVRYSTQRTIVGIRQTAECPVFLLTPAGERASSGWTRARSPSAEETYWTVPIGRRTLTAVTGLTAAPDGSTLVAYEWKWTPNDMGRTLQEAVPKAQDFFARKRSARASCRQWDDGWRCELGLWMHPEEAFGEFSRR